MGRHAGCPSSALPCTRASNLLTGRRGALYTEPGPDRQNGSLIVRMGQNGKECALVVRDWPLSTTPPVAVARPLPRGRAARRSGSRLLAARLLLVLLAVLLPLASLEVAFRVAGPFIP